MQSFLEVFKGERIAGNIRKDLKLKLVPLIVEEGRRISDVAREIGIAENFIASLEKEVWGRSLNRFLPNVVELL